MGYIEKLKKNLEAVKDNKTMPTVNNGEETTVTYTKSYKGGEGDKKIMFYYKIVPSMQAHFNNCYKTFVEITFEEDIDIELYRNRIVPQEIVANIFGYNTYKELYENQTGIPDALIKQIQKMVVSLIPITEQEFSAL